MNLSAMGANSCRLCHGEFISSDSKASLRKIGLSDYDMQQFHNVFIEILTLSRSDKESDDISMHTIPISNVLKYIEIENNVFMMKLLCMLLPSKSLGKFETFIDFCFALWNLGTITQAALGKLICSYDATW